MSESRQSFGVQAARFSLFVPLTVVFIGVLTRINAANAPSVGIAVAWINGGLIVLGFILGLVALISMRRFGPKGIFARAITGVVINGLLLFVLIGVVMAARGLSRNRQLLHGHWQMQSSPDKSYKQLDLSLNADNSFVLDGDKPDGAPIRMSGSWKIAERGMLGVTINSVQGADANMNGKHVELGAVKTIDDQQLILSTEKGDETYRRVK
jgi:hypothetical protein